MSKYRIMRGSNDRYKIQVKFMLFFWLDLQHTYTLFTAAKDDVNTLIAYDLEREEAKKVKWKVVE